MSYANIFITGANRGFGLELVKQYAAKASTKQLFATCRDVSNATDLEQLAAENDKVKILELDMRDYDSYEEVVDLVAEDVGSQGLNLLINNASIHIGSNFHDATREDLLEVYEVNVVAPFLLTRALTPLLQASAKAGSKTFVANISSKVGSIADNTSGQMYAYRTSEAAFNQVSKSLSIQFKDDGIIVASIHPGWVQTDMGGPNAPIDVKTSVENMIATFEAITPALSLPLEELDVNPPGPATPSRRGNKLPRESIAQWSVQRRQKKMSVENLAGLFEGHMKEFRVRE